MSTFSGEDQTAVAPPLALSLAYEGIGKISFQDAHYRKYIGLYCHLPKHQIEHVKQSKVSCPNSS